MQHLPKLLVEFIGTFFLCLAVALNTNAGTMNIIAIVGVLTAMIYAGGPISAAHYNPAITLSFYLRGRISLRLGVYYVLAQCLAAGGAALCAQQLLSTSFAPFPLLENWSAALTAEVLGTFALAFVIMAVATSKHSKGNEYYGLAIGSAVAGLAYLLGPYSGAMFNPAVALSQTSLGMYAWGELGFFWVVCPVGAAAATLVYNVVDPA
ncbi:MAG: aquaporin [Bacteroidota bacterium]